MKTITPFKYTKTIQAPFSKSYLQRAIAIAGLLRGTTKIKGFTPSNDALVALNILEQMGSKYHIHEDEVTITTSSNIVRKRISINCGEAGLSTRMFGSILAILYDEVTMDGEGSIKSRPMNMVIEALEELGIFVESNNGFLPIKTKGNVKQANIVIDGSESSQLLTGLLIGLATLDRPTTITVKDLKSIPYVQMTIDILAHFGIQINHDGFKNFQIDEAQFNQSWQSREYKVEGDWSGASFHIVGGAISGKTNLIGLNRLSAQADQAILEAVIKAGAKISWTNGELSVEKDYLTAFDFDASQCPDLFPPIAALASCCEGTSRIYGTHRLTNKESNRALTIQSELQKLGIEVRLKDDYMEITGGTIQGGCVSSNNDHRIAMMCSILATVCEHNIEIEDPEAINKSYPEFYRDIEVQTGILR